MVAEVAAALDGSGEGRHSAVLYVNHSMQWRAGGIALDLTKVFEVELRSALGVIIRRPLGDIFAFEGIY